MPIYEFQCECGHRFERLCKMNDDPFFPCPECGAKGRRVMSAFRRGRSSSGNSAADSFSSGSGCSGCSGCSSSSCASCH